MHLVLLDFVFVPEKVGVGLYLRLFLQFCAVIWVVYAVKARDCGLLAPIDRQCLKRSGEKAEK